MKRFIFVLLGTLVLVGAGCAPASSEKPKDLAINYDDQPVTEPITQKWAFPGVLSDKDIQHKQIRIKMAKGDIVFELFGDTAPKTVSNFVYLTQGGYFNGLTFHRREEGFVIQGGDPKGNGTGGPGYEFEDELADGHAYERGVVAMANHGPNTNGSQFFVMLGNVPLPKAYSIFGRVVDGMDVVDQIQIGDVMQAVTVEDQP
ncbi:peptidylprolyl isomerase [Candidatus Uhrbacteria bacterium]|nr:peptidylprolyl isomerase [Candidatus Uhrbacteria bacterium]